jgi:hypothetical protein
MKQTFNARLPRRTAAFAAGLIWLGTAGLAMAQTGLAGGAPSRVAPATAPAPVQTPAPQAELTTRPIQIELFAQPQQQQAQQQQAQQAPSQPTITLFETPTSIASQASNPVATQAVAPTPGPITVPVPGASPIERIEFRGGRFVQTADQPGRWLEMKNDGTVNYEFYQAAASPGMIELTGSQGLVRLFIDLNEKVVRGQWPGQTLKVVYRITQVVERGAGGSKPKPKPTPAPAPKPTPEPIPAPTPGPVDAGAPHPRDLQFAAYKGGRFERVSEKRWQQVTADGQTFTYDMIAFDDVSVFLFDAASNVLVSLEPARREARMTTPTHYLQPFSPLTEVSDKAMTPAPAPAEGQLSQAERNQCLKTGGKVERAGILGAERCTRPFTDGGMSCLDSSQCQGQCRTSLDTPAGTPVTGTCQINDNPFGCFAEVVAGRAGAGLCVD